MNNKIFVGPPGSGKTYRAKYEVIKAIWSKMNPDERKLKTQGILTRLIFVRKHLIMSRSTIVQKSN